MKVKLEPYWCIVRSCGTILNLTSRRSKKKCIESFIENSERVKKLSWKEYQNEGYRCYKFEPILLSK